MAATPIKLRVQKRRNALRQAGLRPVQLWVPDTRREDFAAECSRQAKIAAAVDRGDTQLAQLLDEAAADIDGWK